MKGCPNCGYEPDMMTGSEIQKKYGITVVNVPLGDLVSPVCLCGHHAKDHAGEGTMGTCRVCFGTMWAGVHNFTPKKHTKQLRFPLEGKP